MYREVTEKLKEWKDSGAKKAFFITGARQIGKTYIVREFGRNNYTKFVEINFIENKDANKLFENVSTAKEIITNITAMVAEKLIPGETLIFFDEIQECPAARTAIKFLVDDGRFDYIESGSLLGVSYKEVLSYPVGYEMIYQMYPMNLREFFIANGVQDETFDYLRKCYDLREPVSASVHATMCKLFGYYMIVGGMPDVVGAFIDTHDIGQVVEIQKSILELYRQDISKYATKDKVKIKDIFDRIPAELNEKNKRFIISSVKKTARMERYEESFLWLNDAGVALPCYNVSEPVVPLKLNEKRNLFKLFLSDSGLLCAASLENVQYEILQGNLTVNMGSVLENVFAQILVANGFELRYFDKKGRAELDFLIQKGKDIIPIEVKSGHSYKEHAAIDSALKTPQWGMNSGIVFCEGNVEQGNGVIYMPWYMAMFLKQEKIERGLIADVDLSGLEIL